MAAERPRSVRTAGWMPRASSRSSAEASWSSRPRRSRNGPTASGSPGRRRRATWTSRTRLTSRCWAPSWRSRSIFLPGVVRGLEDAGPRSAQFGRPGGLDLVAQQRLLGRAPLRDVEDRAVHPQPPAGAGHRLAAIEHPAHLAVGAHDPVLEHERLVVLGRAGDALEHLVDVVGMDDAEDRALGGRQEARRRVARDPLDLVADHLQHEVRVPAGAVDRAGDVLHQGPQQPVVTALLRGAQPRPRSRDQLRARERPVQVVVGARVEHRVRHPPLRGHRDREQPRIAQPRVLAQDPADRRRVQPGRVAVDDDEVDRLLLERRPGRIGTPNRPRCVPRGA